MVLLTITLKSCKNIFLKLVATLKDELVLVLPVRVDLTSKVLYKLPQRPSPIVNLHFREMTEQTNFLKSLANGAFEPMIRLYSPDSLM
jgi:hypothetical protein